MILLTVTKVALLLPDEKCVTQSWKNKSGQDFPGTGVGTQKADAMS